MTDKEKGDLEAFLESIESMEYLPEKQENTSDAPLALPLAREEDTTAKETETTAFPEEPASEQNSIAEKTISQKSNIKEEYKSAKKAIIVLSGAWIYFVSLGKIIDFFESGLFFIIFASVYSFFFYKVFTFLTGFDRFCSACFIFAGELLKLIAIVFVFNFLYKWILSPVFNVLGERTSILFLLLVLLFIFVIKRDFFKKLKINLLIMCIICILSATSIGKWVTLNHIIIAVCILSILPAVLQSGLVQRGKEKQDGEAAVPQYEEEETIADNEVNSDAEMHLHHAWEYLRREDYPGALSVCNKVIDMEPENVAAYLLRAEVYEEWFDMDDDGNNLCKAVDDYTRAITLCPNNGLYYEKRGELYQRLDCTEVAEADFAKARQLE